MVLKHLQKQEKGDYGIFKEPLNQNLMMWVAGQLRDIQELDAKEKNGAHLSKACRIVVD